MRTPLLLALLMALAATSPLVRAQSADTSIVVVVPPHVDEPPPTNMLTADPLELIDNFLVVFYHRRVWGGLSVGLGGRVAHGFATGISGFGAQPEIVYTFSRGQFDGVFVGVAGRYDYLTYSPLSVDPLLDVPGRLPRVTEPFAWVGPIAGLYIGGPKPQLVTAVAVGYRYTFLAGTHPAAGPGSDTTAFGVYLSARLGFTW
jgi:hypothetical protein